MTDLAQYREMAVSEDETDRRKVTWLLSEEDTREAVEIIYELLDDKSEMVRSYAVRAISNSRFSKVDCRVLRDHLDDESPYVRAEIVAAIQIRCRRLLRFKMLDFWLRLRPLRMRWHHD